MTMNTSKVSSHAVLTSADAVLRQGLKKARRRQGTEEGGGGGGGKSFVSCSRRDNSCQNEASAT